MTGIADFNRKMDNLNSAYSRMPGRSAVIAVEFTKQRFQQQNWIGNTTEPWRKRKENAKLAARNRGRGILVKSGRLKRSIRKYSVTATRAVIGTDVPYARIHNEGGRITTAASIGQYSRRNHGRVQPVKAHTRQMNTTIPRRQFLGESRFLANRIERDMASEVLKALKS